MVEVAAVAVEMYNLCPICEHLTVNNGRSSTKSKKVKDRVPMGKHSNFTLTQKFV